MAEVASAHGYVNAVIANAGITGPSLQRLPPNSSLADFRAHVWNWDTDSFNQTFAVNTTATFNTVAAFLELLDAGNKRGNLKQKSQVIATSSIGAFNRNPLVGFAYGGSKIAVVHIIKQLSTYLGPFDIRANVIAPGCESSESRPCLQHEPHLIRKPVYPSDLTQEVIRKHEQTGWPRNVIPEGRPGDLEDVGGAILFLLSKAGSYINGNVLVTDGGRLGVMPSTY